MQRLELPIITGNPKNKNQQVHLKYRMCGCGAATDEMSQ